MAFHTEWEQEETDWLRLLLFENKDHKDGYINVLNNFSFILFYTSKTDSAHPQY